uniref:Uncharacterized protein n=1 Tax=Arundo donax TaxID=35708 RepID=A0A0A9ADL8_ARUDO
MDDLRYGAECGVRWRHFMVSDFMTLAMADRPVCN